MRSPTKLQRLVQTIYSSGCELHVSKAGAVLVRSTSDPEGAVSFALTQQVSRQQQPLWSMLEDPDSKEAYEGRSALFHQALGFMDRRIRKKHGERGVELATKALCTQRANDELNRAWNEGSFEEFRAALREYVQVGLRAARGEKQAMEMEAVG